MRNVLLIVHIAAIAVWFGGSIMNGVINAKIAGTNDMSAKATLARSEVNLGTQVYMPVAILTLLSGIGLVVVGDFQFESIWVSFGFLTIIVSAVLGPVKFKPLSERIAVGYEGGDVAAADAATTQITMWSSINTALLFIAIVLMVIKP